MPKSTMRLAGGLLPGQHSEFEFFARADVRCGSDSEVNGRNREGPLWPQDRTSSELATARGGQWTKVQVGSILQRA